MRAKNTDVCTYNIRMFSQDFYRVRHLSAILVEPNSRSAQEKQSPLIIIGDVSLMWAYCLKWSEIIISLDNPIILHANKFEAVFKILRYGENFRIIEFFSAGLIQARNYRPG